MRRISRYISGFMTLAVAGMMNSCTDDFNPDNRNSDSDNQGVVIYVPQSQPGVTRSVSQSLTRSEGDVWDYNDDELTLKHIYLFAYPTTGDLEPIRCELTETVSTIPEDLTGYKGYKINIPAGTYDMYVVANHTFTSLEISKETLLNEPATIPSDLISEGLPMSCSTMKLKDNDTYRDVSEITVTQGADMTIKADLKFAVSKVRTTIINDLKRSSLVSDPKLENVYSESYLIGGQSDKNYTGTKGTKNLSGFYYRMPSLKNEKGEDIEIKDVSVDGLELIGDSPAEGEGWAWQSVSYVGEYLFADSETQKPSLSLKIGNSAITPVQFGTGGGVKRSTFYDIVGTTKGEFAIAIQDWNLEIIALSLRGSYFLNIDATAVSVSSGSGTAIKYETNGPLSFKGNGTIDGSENGTPFYYITYDNDSIYISLAPQLTKTQFEDIKANHTDRWQTIRIQAGTIVKYIEVKDIVYQEYLKVEEERLTVDVRVRIGAGAYYGDIEIPIKTNLQNFTISKADGWEDIDGEEYETKSLILEDEDGIRLSDLRNQSGSGVTGSDNDYTIDSSCVKNGAYNLHVAYTGLNEGREFWRNTHTLMLNVSGTVEGEPVIIPVQINVLPNVDKYRIYLYAPEWSHPHVYVYECLQYPAGYKTSSNEERGGMPIGASAETAALQYSFTGALAFKGWDNGDNKLSDYDGKTLNNGFYVFGSNWEPKNDNNDIWKHYYDFDFCAEYRSGIPDDLCKDCKYNSSFNRGWPGIVMAKEEMNGRWTGWWYFDLSGVATPGKALIMFNDDHKNSSSRVPDEKTNNKINPGIALFDYSNRIGYLDATGNKIFKDKEFHPERPEVKPVTNIIVRIEKSKIEENLKYLYTWTTGDKHYFGAFSSASERTGEKDGYYYWDTTVDASTSVTNLAGGIFKNIAGDNPTERMDFDNSNWIVKESESTAQAFGATYLFTVKGTDAYSNVWVNVPGDHNGWVDNGAHPRINGVSLHKNLTIGKGKFKIKTNDGNGNDGWYSNNSSIPTNNWTSIVGNSGDMTISGANDNDTYNVEWDYINKRIRVIKSN